MSNALHHVVFGSTTPAEDAQTDTRGGRRRVVLGDLESDAALLWFGTRTGATVKETVV